MPGEILYNFPAMLEMVTELESQSAGLRALGSSIEAQQRLLAHTWEGSASLAYQNWQMQWNTNSEQLAESLNAIAMILSSNTMAMAEFEMQQMATWI